MPLHAAEASGKLLGLEVEWWALHAVGDLEKLPGNDGKQAAGKHVTCMCLDYLSHE